MVRKGAPAAVKDRTFCFMKLLPMKSIRIQYHAFTSSNAFIHKNIFIGQQSEKLTHEIRFCFSPSCKQLEKSEILLSVTLRSWKKHLNNNYGKIIYI